MAASDRRPVVRAPVERWQLLGELLQLRRSELGYRRRPAFTREHDINIRLVTDIENAYRPDTFLTPTLREIAQAYQVTYDSLTAVLAGKQDTLHPAPPPAPAGLPPAPPSNLLREDAARPYAAQIWNRLMKLAATGVPDPDGRHPRDWGPGDWDSWSPSAEQLGLSGQDADTWDASRGAMSLSDRGWLTGDWHARRQARNPGREAGTASA